MKRSQFIKTLIAAPMAIKAALTHKPDNIRTEFVEGAFVPEKPVRIGGGERVVPIMTHHKDAIPYMCDSRLEAIQSIGCKRNFKVERIYFQRTS